MALRDRRDRKTQQHIVQLSMELTLTTGGLQISDPELRHSERDKVMTLID